jgi:hypothetical protein
MLLSEGQMSDCKGAALMFASLPRAKAMIADKGYDGDWFRQAFTLKWSRLFGQFGSEVKLIPGFDYAASWSVSVAGACPGNGRFSFAR